MIPVFVIVIGALQARMNYRAYRHAMLLTVCALLWIATVIGLL